MRSIAQRHSIPITGIALATLAFGPRLIAEPGVDRAAVPSVVSGSPSVVRGSPDPAHPDSAPADPSPARFAAEIRAFEEWDRKNSFPRDAVLFVGSSSIRMWPTAESFPKMAVINRGFGGSHISDVNHFAKRLVLKYNPRVTVFYAGDNDIEADKPSQQVFDDFQAFLKLVHDRLPETAIVYLPIKPSLARWQKWPRMRDVNLRIERLSRDDKRLTYVDTATPMVGDDGRPRPELFLDDGLHLNARGYEEWTAIVAPVLEQLSADN
jgi:lysophospholipase L1-like esterase